MSEKITDPELAKQIEQSRDAQMQAESEEAAHARLQAQFASDPRIHYSRETQTWHFEGDDGREMEWDATKNTWIEVVDEDMVKAQQAAYAVEGVDEETPAAPILARNNKKRPSIKLLKHMFTRQELDEDATLLLDLKEDVREECSTLGEVTNIVLYDEENDGVMTVKFKDPVSAQACILKMNGRFFAGRRIQAEFYDGRERYKKSGDVPALDADGEEGDDAERKRLDDFAAWLMKDGE
ncbi:hypothetical protein FS749_006654 [Ceratobasidium sp. UAMH 11750]|nr:hypothetical protein FS749_006654 [Ceratobasidium sp. UAMH 11750]